MVFFDCFIFLRTWNRFGMDPGVDCFYCGGLQRHTNPDTNAYTDTNSDTNSYTDDALLRTRLYNRQGIRDRFDRVLQRRCLSGSGRHA
jgi:hypothetical protein